MEHGGSIRIGLSKRAVDVEGSGGNKAFRVADRHRPEGIGGMGDIFEGEGLGLS